MKKYASNTETDSQKLKEDNQVKVEILPFLPSENSLSSSRWKDDFTVNMHDIDRYLHTDEIFTLSIIWWLSFLYLVRLGDLFTLVYVLPPPFEGMYDIPSMNGP